MKVTVYFRQARPGVHCIWKEIELAALPTVGSLFEYQDGWGLAEVGEKLQVHITSSTVSISGYGVQFSEAEISSLQDAGWTVEAYK